MHSGAFNREHLLQLGDDRGGLRLGRLVGVDFYISLIHCFLYNRDWELVAVVCVDAHIGDDVGNLHLQLLKLVSTFHFTHLEFAFVQNFD